MRRSAPPAAATAVQPRPARFGALVFLFGFIALMWVTEGFDALVRATGGGPGLDDDGVRPLSYVGLIGIVLQPFLHSGWAHLVGNSIAMAVLGSVIALSGLRPLVRVTLVSWLVSGVTCWLIGGIGSVHIGASGIVFGYIFFVIARGVFTRRPGHLIIGLLVAGYYGLGALAGLSPLQEGVSWQGHLGGAIAGVSTASGAAARTRPRPAVPPAGPGVFAGPPR